MPIAYCSLWGCVIGARWFYRTCREIAARLPLGQSCDRGLPPLLTDAELVGPGVCPENHALQLFAERACRHARFLHAAR